MSFLTRSRMCPTDASTVKVRPKNFFSVLVLAGLSTMTRFLATVAHYNLRGWRYFVPPRWRPEQGGDSTIGRQAPQGRVSRSENHRDDPRGPEPRAPPQGLTGPRCDAFGVRLR